MMQKIIKQLSEKRYEFLRQYENSYDENLQDYTMEEPVEIDMLGENILSLIMQSYKELPIDFVIEELTKLGQAPSILYDDNGNFAITGDGTQDVVFEPSDMTITHFIKKEMWKPTIREALEYYLFKSE